MFIYSSTMSLLDHPSDESSRFPSLQDTLYLRRSTRNSVLAYAELRVTSRNSVLAYAELRDFTQLRAGFAELRISKSFFGLRVIILSNGCTYLTITPLHFDLSCRNLTIKPNYTRLLPFWGRRNK